MGIPNQGANRRPRFRWNRRKVADYLDVSYKTLLTKMKECGISEGADG